MKEQGLTKFILVTVLMSIVLVIAVFSPQTPPVEASQLTDLGESESPSLEELKQRAYTLDEREAELDQRQVELDEREAGLNQHQAELDVHESGLDQRQAELGEYEARLDQRQAELDEREAKLEEQKATLQIWGESLVEQNELLDKGQKRLWEQEVRLAEWEQKLEGRQRLSVVVAVVSGLLAVPSVMVLLTLIRQGQQAPIFRPHQEEQISQHSKLAKILAPTYSDNGQDKRSVQHMRFCCI